MVNMDSSQKAGSYNDLYEKLSRCYEIDVLPDYKNNLERFSKK